MIDPVVFKRGDQLTIECIYDTMNENTTVSQTVSLSCSVDKSNLEKT